MAPPLGRPTSPEARSRARALARRLRALDAGEVRILAAGRAIAALEAEAAAEVVGALVDLAALGDPIAVVAVGRALGGGAVPYEQRAALYQAAASLALRTIGGSSGR